jgi:hypothetical protein
MVSGVSMRGLTLATGAVLPLGYIATRHVQWMESPEAKKRMAVRWGSVIASTAATVWLLHQVVIFRMAKAPLWLQLIGTSVVATLPMLAFEGGRVLAKRVFPKPLKPTLAAPATLTAVFKPPPTLITHQ